MSRLKTIVLITVFSILFLASSTGFSETNNVSLKLNEKYGAIPGQESCISVNLANSVSATSGSIEITSAKNVYVESGEWMTETEIAVYHSNNMLGAFSVTDLDNDNHAIPRSFGGTVFNIGIKLSESVSAGKNIENALRVRLVLRNGSKDVLDETAVISFSAVDINSEGMVKIDGIWYYAEKGVIKKDFSGYVDYNSRRYRIDNGKWSTGFTAVANDDEGRYYSGGVWQPATTGFINTNGDNKSLYQWKVIDGVLDKSFEGLYKIDGIWRYYRDGRFQDTTTGFATDMTRFVASGRKTIYRYRIEKGLINFKFSGMAETGNSRYYKDGRWMNTYTGYCNDTADLSSQYEYYVINGTVDTEYEGLYKVDEVWRYYRNGKFQGSTNGFATDMARYISGKGTYRYRIEKGLINFHFSGLAETGNKRYYKDGRWMNQFTGTVTLDGVDYNIRHGIVVE